MGKLPEGDSTVTGRIMVAVDFGTTFSAIGYAFCKDGVTLPEIDFHLVDSSWPGQGGRRSHKVPSVYKFCGDRFEMGFEIEDDPDRISFAKLFLDPSQLQKGEHLAKLNSIAVEHSEEFLMHGISMYLRSLKDGAFAHMKKVLEHKVPKDLMKEDRVDFILSMPAVWSERAKANTLECAYRAGMGSRNRFGSIRLVPEPEAAAVYAITTLPQETWKVGSRFILVDAGGGTVDLSSYRIASPPPDLQLHQEVIGGGGLCGSTMLNMRFKDFLNEKLKQNISKEDMNEIMLKFNDEIKPSFDGNDDIFSIDLPDDVEDNPDQGIEGGTLVLTGDDLQKIFEAIVKKIIFFIQCQLDKMKGDSSTEAPHILLVGGFGSSQYLKERVETHFESCRVLQPPNAWSAVVRGALLRTMVKTRKINACYGVIFSEEWTSEKHENGPLAEYAQQYKKWDRFEHVYRCTGRMRWYVKKGDEFDNVRRVKFPFYQNFGVHNSLKSMEIQLWEYFESEEGADGPPFKDFDCQSIAILRPDLSRIDRREFPKLTSPSGEPYLKVNYELVMTFDGFIEFELQYKGKSYGSVKVDYGSRSFVEPRE